VFTFTKHADGFEDKPAGSHFGSKKMTLSLDFASFLSPLARSIFDQEGQTYKDFGEFLKTWQKLEMFRLAPGQLKLIFDCLIEEEIMLDEISIQHSNLSCNDIAKWAKYLANHQLSCQLKILNIRTNTIDEPKHIQLFEALWRCLVKQ
jgi:hypothetical protein